MAELQRYFNITPPTVQLLQIYELALLKKNKSTPVGKCCNSSLHLNKWHINSRHYLERLLSKWQWSQWVKIQLQLQPAAVFTEVVPGRIMMSLYIMVY